MENNQKRVLLNLAYFTLIGLGIIFSILFAVRVANSTLPILVQIIYYVWTAVLVITLIYDVYCTFRGGMKYYVGWIFFILTLLCVIMAAVVFVVDGISIAGIETAEIGYFINTMISFIPVKLAIFAFLFGQKIINFHD